MCLVGFAACGGGTKPSSQATGDTVDFKYARLLHAVRHDGYTEVSISDPWHKGKVLHKYVLVPRGGSVPGNVPEGTVVRVWPTCSMFAIRCCGVCAAKARWPTSAAR